MSKRDDRSIVLSSAREHAYEDYLCALFSPHEARQDLFTLAAFTGELNRISWQVRDPILAEIRFQWWREVLEKGEITGHPIADAILELKARRGLPLPFLCSDVETKARELDPQILSCATTLKNHLKLCERASLQMRTFLLGHNIEDVGETVFAGGAEILGSLRYCRRLPLLRARRHVSQKGSSLEAQFENSRLMELGEDDTRDLIHNIDAAYRLLRTEVRKLKWGQHFIFLPLSLVRPHLKVLRTQRAHNISSSVQLSGPMPLTLIVALFFSARFRLF